MTTCLAQWRPFPYDAPSFDYKGVSLKKHWGQLHRGDCEPYPDEQELDRQIRMHPGLKPGAGLKATASALQEAWRTFHCGDYGAAVSGGLAIGRLGFGVANKAAILYATYLEDSGDAKRDMLLAATHRAEEIQSIAPSLANGWYFHAQALGRYGQQISVTKALAEGLSDKVRGSLERTLELEPRHADANIALGLYHAVIIQKMGSLVGRLTYGASGEAALAHFAAALKLNPDSAITRVEYANGLVMIYGKSRMAEALRLCQEAADCEPSDATERLEVELAKAELRD
jgi:hypothetical protein